MKRTLNENQKISLTFNQIRDIIEESTSRRVTEGWLSDMIGKISSKFHGSDIKKLAASGAGYDELKDNLDASTFEGFCRKLNFLVTNEDPKSQALYEIFKKGWKKEYDPIKVDAGKFVSIRDLHPTQNVIFARKSLGKVLNGSWKVDGYEFAVDAFLSSDSPQITMGDPIVVCNVGGIDYLIDGHHRWSKVYAFNPNATMCANVIDAGNYFGTADDVLKFAQGTLTASQGTSPIHKQPDDDVNLYKISQKELYAIISGNLSEEVLSHIVAAPITNEVVTDIRTLFSYLWANVLTMRKFAPKGEHAREFMPQFPDGDSNPANAVDRIAAESAMHLNHRQLNDLMGFRP